MDRRRLRATAVAFAALPASWLAGCGSSLAVRAPGSLYAPVLFEGGVVFATPIVTESRISYEDSHTGQEYHQSDKARTRDAILRELRFSVEKRKLGWQQVDAALDTALSRTLADVHEPLDSLPARVADGHGVAGEGAVLVIYDVRLVHEHSVGSNVPLPQVASYTNRVNKDLQLKCALIDRVTNRRRFLAQVAAQEDGSGLTIVERSVRTLLKELLLTEEEAGRRRTRRGG